MLASKSNIRKKLLRQVGLSFKVVPSNLNEKKLKVEHANKSLTFLASKLASEKAKSISKLYEGAYVIGADQICVLKNKPLGKPKNINNAIEQLCSLNGLEHKQISAFSIYLDGKLVNSFILAGFYLPVPDTSLYIGNNKDQYFNGFITRAR